MYKTNCAHRFEQMQNKYGTKHCSKKENYKMYNKMIKKIHCKYKIIKYIKQSRKIYKFTKLVITSIIQW